MQLSSCFSVILEKPLSMKNWLTLFFISLNILLLSQTTREFSPGKKNKFTDAESKLVLTPKNSVHFLKRNVDDFIYAKKVEVKNIKNPEVLEQIAQRVLLMSRLEELTFNNCDLFFLTYEFSLLGKLKNLKVLNTYLYELNDIIYSLKANPNLTDLTLTTDELSNLPDSIYLLRNLKNFNLVNVNPGKSNSKTYRTTFTYTSNGKSNTVDVVQTGFEQPLAVDLRNDDAQTNSSEMPEDNFAFSNNVIKPPVSGVDINNAVYTFKTGSDQVLYYESGSTLQVPKSSFMTSDGKEYNGNVTVFYREFRTPLEQILSGIPMTNQENGEANQFVSGGMYELWAFNDKKERLQLKPEKRITINFKPTTDSGTYRFWSLDTASGKWTGSKQNIDLTSNLKGNSTISKAIREFVRERKKNNRRTFDPTRFTDRFENQDYIGIINCKNYQFNKEFTKYSMSDYEDAKKRKLKSKYKIRSVRVNKNGDVLFKFSTNTNYNYKYVYEYGMGQNLTSLHEKQLKMVGGGLTKQEFKTKYLSEPISDIRLEDRGGYLVLKLKTRNGILELPFNIVDYDSEAKEFIVKTKTERATARHFNLRLATAAKVHDKKNIRHLNEEYYDYIKQPSRSTANILAFEKTKNFRNSSEKTLSFEAFVRRADSAETVLMLLEKQFTGDPKLDTIIASAASVLIYSDLGFKNIDYYLHKNMVNDLYVNYVKPETNESVKTEFATTVVKEINTSINNFASDKDGVSIRYIRGKDFTLLRIDEDGYIQADKIDENSLKSTAKITLPLNNKVYIKGKSSDEIAKLMNL